MLHVMTFLHLSIESGVDRNTENMMPVGVSQKKGSSINRRRRVSRRLNLTGRLWELLN